MSARSVHEQWADDLMRRLRAKNVWTHPHHWRLDARRNVYVGVDAVLGEVAAEMVEAVRDDGDVVGRRKGERRRLLREGPV